MTPPDSGTSNGLGSCLLRGGCTRIVLLPGLLREEGRRFFQEIDLHPGLTQLGFDFLVLGKLGRRLFLTLNTGMGFPSLTHPVSHGLRDQTVGLCHIADRAGVSQ